MTVSNPADITYTILAPGSTIIPVSMAAPTVTSTDSACTLTTVLERHTIGWNNYEDPGNQLAWITNFDSGSKSFDIATANNGIAGLS